MDTTKFDAAIAKAIVTTEEEIRSLKTVINKLSLLLQDKDMQTDKSENASYQQAVDERAMKNSMLVIKQLQLDSLKREQVGYTPSGIIKKGSTVALELLTVNGLPPTTKNTRFEIRLVEPETAVAKDGLVAIKDCAVGAGVMGRTSGETITIYTTLGTLEYKIEEVV